MLEISKWFVIITGIYDLVLGAGLIAATPRRDAVARAAWPGQMTLAGFLLFAGVLLIWGALDLTTRGFVVAWQGLLRIGVAGVIAYALKRNYVTGPTARTSRIAGGIDFIIFSATLSL